MNIFAKIRAWGKTSSLRSIRAELLQFRAIAGQLPALPTGSRNQALLARLTEGDEAHVSFEDLYAGRLVLVEVMPIEGLKMCYRTLADEHEAITSKPFGNGMLDKEAKIEEWRAAIVSLTGQLAKFRRAKLMFER